MRVPDRQPSRRASSARPVHRGRVGAVLVLAGLLLLFGAVGAPADTQQPEAPQRRVVEVIELDGLVDGQVAAFLREQLDAASQRGAELLVLSLDVSGGVGVDRAGLVQPILDSDVPVLAYVGDAGARAHGAGAWLAQAAHVLALAPVTQTGDALPLDLADPEGFGASGAEAYVELAARRGRSVEVAAAQAAGAVVVVRPEGTQAGTVDPSAVPEGAEVVELSPSQVTQRTVAELVAQSLPDALDALEGAQVEVSGEVRTLSLPDEQATVRFQNLGLLRRVLHTVADPTLAYVLLVAGALALGFEAFQPGFGVAGISALPLLVLGVYGLAVLPTNWLAFAALLAGFLLLAADLALARLGPLTGLGTVALAVGSWWLYPRTGPAGEVLAISGWLVAALVAFSVVFFVVIMTQVLKAQGSQALLHAEEVIGQRAVVRSMLNPEGHVFVKGQLWRARAPEAAGRVSTGTVVVIVGLNDQLTLDVQLDDAPVDGAARGVPG